MNKLRAALAIAFLLLVVFVDFTSKLLSIAADGLLIGVFVVVIWPVIKPGLTGKNE